MSYCAVFPNDNAGLIRFVHLSTAPNILDSFLLHNKNIVAVVGGVDTWINFRVTYINNRLHRFIPASGAALLIMPGSSVA
jgi:hypothetical protein